MLPVVAGAVGAGVNALTGVIGYFLSQADDEKSYQQRKEILARALGVSVPELETLVAKEQGPTALAGVKTDPALELYQDEAQRRLADVGRAGGLDAQARARLEQGRLESAQAERSSREAILSDARQRGTLGGGSELSALIQAGQSSADRERMAGLQTLSDAEQRALSAIQASGSMAAQRQATQWGQRAQVATAQDEINRFNTSSANDFTLANAQQRQQQFQNQLQLTGMQNQAQGDMANYYAGRAATTRQVVGGVGQALGAGISALGQSGGGATAQAAAPAMQVSPLATNAGYAPVADDYLSGRRKAR